ncbi:hypothetical protein BTN49_2657 [Candidatus Enterovibrio escicola]|uniref:Uncharacterized protein n=2 Tax=Candidatus Enterovibrio escicola TaxID=1927127 RepID=A0A2A5T0F7_9GAMM|nr:hypothetical protein BTN49_2657 [Candidatus Enterovibrio escacola]
MNPDLKVLDCAIRFVVENKLLGNEKFAMFQPSYVSAKMWVILSSEVP